MAGNQLGYLKGKMGLKGKTKAGDMISKMNAMKTAAMKPKKVAKKAVVKKIIKKVI